MAVVFVRSLLSPKSESGKYTSLRCNSSPVNAMERGNSLGNEKAQSSAYSATSLPARINPRIISDATIGLSDGLTVPFALTAGLSALGQTKVVIYGGFAELVAGGISMGLGGYLGAKSEAESYQAALIETRAIVADDQDEAVGLIRSAFREYDFSEGTISDMTATLLASPTQLVDFLMKFHHRLAEADFAPSRAYISGLTIALGYVCGGLIALLPYLFFSSIQEGFYGSIVVMALALFVFGWIETSLVGENDRWICLKNGVQMMILGGIAAGAAITSVKAIGS
ncbi:calcium transporter [Teratosphaeria destructans]|uniref:Calcium transporter n=1 Tax=Teratosphaeria destructans TaxID=418781 RepID=A0A9W7SN67_9PEZI|nr:calcium transporter [Teratosphaeria destructans]